MADTRINLKSFCSPGILLISGSSRGELIGKHILEHHGPEATVFMPVDFQFVSGTFIREVLRAAPGLKLEIEQENYQSVKAREEWDFWSAHFNNPARSWPGIPPSLQD